MASSRYEIDLGDGQIIMLVYELSAVCFKRSDGSGGRCRRSRENEVRFGRAG